MALRLGGAFLDSDTPTERVVQAGLRAAGRLPEDRDSPDYKRHFREAIYFTAAESARKRKNVGRDGS